jgi:hypothetical protein
MGCGILGFAQLLCKTCHERYVVAWSCKGRGFCPSCGGRRMNAGALTLVDHVLPDTPIRHWVLTMPFPLRFPLAFDGALLGQVLRIFTDTVTRWYRQRQADRGLPGGQCGSVTAIHRASSDIRCDPHFHCLFLDGVYAPDGDGKGQMFHPAPAPTQQDVEQVVERASKRTHPVWARSSRAQKSVVCTTAIRASPPEWHPVDNLATVAEICPPVFAASSRFAGRKSTMAPRTANACPRPLIRRRGHHR